MYQSPNLEEHCLSCIDDETFGDDNVELEFPFENSVKSFKIVGSCNGLLCLWNSIFPDKLVLWNSSIRKIVTLPVTRVTAVTESPAIYGAVVGFEFDKRSNDYKVVKIRCLCDLKSGRYVVQAVELYALSTHSWRSICVDDFCNELHFEGTLSAFVNGAVHWIAFVRGLEIFMVVAFDMGDEVFREMALPNHLVNEDPISMFVTVLGESLAVIHCDHYLSSNTFHIWIMEEYGVTESWTKRFTIIMQEAFWRVVGFRENGNVLMVKGDEEELVSYDPRSRRIKHLGVRGYYDSFYMLLLTWRA